MPPHAAGCRVSAHAITIVTLICIAVSVCLADDAAMQAAISDLDSSLPAVREQAAVRLGQQTARGAIGRLIRALQDRSPGVRREAAKAIGFIKDDRAVEGLCQTLRDENASVRFYAAYALGEIKDDRAVRPLVESIRDPEWTVRDQAAWALREIGGVAATELMVQELAEKESDVRQIVWVLRGLDHGIARSQLTGLLRAADAATRLRAVFALGAIPDPSVLPAILDALQDSDAAVRHQAVNALTHLRDARALEPVKSMEAKETDATVRHAAQRAIQILSRSVDLMAHWTLDAVDPQTVIDDTGNGNDGRNVGATSVDGKVGKALRFEKGKYVEIGRPPNMLITDTPLTISAWVKSDTRSGVVVARGGAACGFSLYVNDGVPKFGIHRLQGGPTVIAAGHEEVVGKWVFLAGVVRPDRIELYVNGSLAATAQTDGLLPSECGQGMEIGYDVGNSPAEITDYFVGVIDEVKVYRIAMSADDIAAEFRAVQKN